MTPSVFAAAEEALAGWKAGGPIVPAQRRPGGYCGSTTTGSVGGHQNPLGDITKPGKLQDFRPCHERLWAGDCLCGVHSVDGFEGHPVIVIDLAEAADNLVDVQVVRRLDFEGGGGVVVGKMNEAVAGFRSGAVDRC